VPTTHLPITASRPLQDRQHQVGEGRGGSYGKLADDRYAAAFWDAYDPNAPVGTAASHPTILANPSQAVTPSTFEEARALQASTGCVDRSAGAYTRLCREVHPRSGFPPSQSSHFRTRTSYRPPALRRTQRPSPRKVSAPSHKKKKTPPIGSPSTAGRDEDEDEGKDGSGPSPKQVSARG
jgi:hypothetical protein